MHTSVWLGSKLTVNILDIKILSISIQSHMNSDTYMIVDDMQNKSLLSKYSEHPLFTSSATTM